MEKVALRAEACLQILCTKAMHYAVKTKALQKGETISGYLGAIIMKHLTDIEGIKKSPLLGYKCALGRPKKKTKEMEKSLARVKKKRGRPVSKDLPR